jgi:hypothetical protein
MKNYTLEEFNKILENCETINDLILFDNVVEEMFKDSCLTAIFVIILIRTSNKLKMLKQGMI